MNPRQRRGVILLILAVIGALGVFVMVLSYVAEVESRVGSVATALQLTTDVPPHAPVTPAVVEQVEVPARWLPDAVLRSPEELGERVATSTLRAGSYLQEGMLDERPELDPEQRELAIMIDAETGVSGKVRPGDLVDIYATFEGDRSTGQGPISQLVVTNVRVLDVGPLTQLDAPAGVDEEVQDRLGNFLSRSGAALPITFALSNDEALILAYSESFATKVRLSLLPQGEESETEAADRIFPRPRALGAAQ